MEYIPDPSDYFDKKDREEENKRQKYIKAGKYCENCGEPITSDHGYMIKGALWCENCIEDAIYWLEE